MKKEEIIDFDQIWESLITCSHGVAWKPSVKHYLNNNVEETLRITRQLENGTWKNGKPKQIRIRYPKPRDGLSIQFRDRIYQRSLNDNALYPIMTKGFILDNCACQRGKGTDFARKRIKQMLWNFYTHHGLDGYVLQIDIHGYYQSMQHDFVKSVFASKLDHDVFEMAAGVLDDQYAGNIGYSPGSQMVQIAGISTLNELDHYIKERLRARYYIRYMDDFWLLSDSREKLEHDLSEIVSRLKSSGFTINEKKTHIRRLRDGFSFLGFDYRMTETGKVIMSVDSDNVRHERHKLARLAVKVRRGEVSQEKAQQCFKSWCAHASHGNSKKLIRRMERFYNDLWR